MSSAQFEDLFRDNGLGRPFRTGGLQAILQVLGQFFLGIKTIFVRIVELLGDLFYLITSWVL